MTTKQHPATATTPSQRARDLIVFAEALEEAGFAAYAQRARLCARDVIELAAQLAAERSARQAIQQRHDTYIAYHAAHCFDADGAAKSGVVAQAFA